MDLLKLFQQFYYKRFVNVMKEKTDITHYMCHIGSYYIHIIL